MAGTLPHAVFVETDIDDAGSAMAFAGELTGCAALGTDAASAVGAVPARVADFVAWLRSWGEEVAEPVGNWYEVERVAASGGTGGKGRASFSLDELPPSPEEFTTWQRWAELAREQLAAALDSDPDAAARLAWLAAQDRAVALDLDATVPTRGPGHLLDELYAARDALTAAISTAGPGGAGVRRALRLAIADDLRAAELIQST